MVHISWPFRTQVRSTMMIGMVFGYLSVLQQVNLIQKPRHGIRRSRSKEYMLSGNATTMLTKL